MELLEAILCCVCVATFALLGIAVLVSTICSAVREHRSDLRSAKWEAEREQLERERAVRDAEYHTARMKELENR